MDSTKNPARIKAGKASAASRWHGLKPSVRLDGLTVDQRKQVIELVASIRQTNAAEDQLIALIREQSNGRP